MHKRERWAKQARTIRVELVGANGCHCAVAGLYACANSPVIEMCHLLVSAGYDLGTKLLCFRGGALALTVHGIGDAMRLKVNMGTGFERVSGVRVAPPVRKSRSAAASATSTKRRAGRPLQHRERKASKKRVNA